MDDPAHRSGPSQAHARGRRERPRQLVQRKLYPPPQPRRGVPRVRLTDQLAGLLADHQTVVVSATAGAGKTTAVAAALETFERPTAWLTIDRTDVAAGRLVTYLEAAIGRAIPHLQDVGSDAVANGIAHPEAAAILAEAIADVPLVLVLDELERLGDAPEAWAVVDGFLRYAPPAVSCVLISRRALPLRPPGLLVPVVGEQDLAFTAHEAQTALAALGRATTDERQILAETGGWVTGVLFAAAADRPAATEQGNEPLYDYLSAHILEQLEPLEREFLIRTAVLDEVSPARGAMLGLDRPGERLAALKAAHVPVTWTLDGSMRCHSCFREFLQDRLARRDPAEIADLRARYADLLIAEGHDEEATEELLSIRAFDSALEPAQRAITGIIERRDFDIAQRWLDDLNDADELTTAEIMLAIARDDYRAGARIGDQLVALGRLDELVRSSEYAAVLLVWAYLHDGRSADARRICDALGPGPVLDIIQYTLQLYDGGAVDADNAPQVVLTGGPADALMLVASWGHGRFNELLELPDSGWLDIATDAYRIGALRAMGQIDDALARYEVTNRRTPDALSLNIFVAAELLVDAGRREEAAAASARGRQLALSTGGTSLLAMNSLVEVKRLLRHDVDTVGARRVLDRLEHEGGRRLIWVREIADMWAAMIDLLEDRDERAAESLRQTVKSMLGGGRFSEIQAAAVYLAEAEWRLGEQDASDAAADVALDIATRQGSHHGMLSALRDFPAVASRRLDAEAASDSKWHALNRTIRTQREEAPAAGGGSASMLLEFGTLALQVDGHDRTPRLTRSIELLAFLAVRPSRTATREEVLDALFDGRADDSARSYLRQAIHQVRQLAGTAVPIAMNDGVIAITDARSFTSESVEFVRAVAEAERLTGTERLRRTTEALRTFDRGTYLPRARSGWADERRAELLRVAVGARYECAELAFAAGDLRGASEHLDYVLNLDPHREVAWRLKMRLAAAHGDLDAIVRVFRSCEDTLRGIDTEPAGDTRRLFETLRS